MGKIIRNHPPEEESSSLQPLYVIQREGEELVEVFLQGSLDERHMLEVHMLEEGTSNPAIVLLTQVHTALLAHSSSLGQRTTFETPSPVQSFGDESGSVNAAHLRIRYRPLSLEETRAVFAECLSNALDLEIEDALEP